MKHRQNKERILLPAASFQTPDTPQVPLAAKLAATYTMTLETFQLSTKQTIELRIDTELRNEFREKSNHEDETIRGIRENLKNGVLRDSKIAVGLCEEKDRLFTYDGLIWIPEDDELRIRILRDHHDARTAGHPGQARTLELVSQSFY
jgi:hypothetical protein